MKLKTLAEKHDYTCHYCGRKFPLEQLTRDHVVPFSKLPKTEIQKKRRSGGNVRTAHGTELVLACNLCNLNKGDK